MCLFSARANHLEENKPGAAALLQILSLSRKSLPEGEVSREKMSQKKKGNIFQAEHLNSWTLRPRNTLLQCAWAVIWHRLQLKVHCFLCCLIKSSQCCKPPLIWVYPCWQDWSDYSQPRRGTEKNVDALVPFLLLWQTSWPKVTHRREGVFQLTHLGHKPSLREVRVTLTQELKQKS